MHELKYGALAAPLWNWGHQLGDLKNECLRDVAEGLNWYFIRLSNFGLLPAWIALEAIREQLWKDYARITVANRINPDLLENFYGDISEEIAKEFNQLALEHRQRPVTEHRTLLREIGIRYIESRLAIKEQDAIPKGIEILLASIVKDSWTAFETTAKETWAVLLDNDDGTVLQRVDGNLTRSRPSKRITPTFNRKTHPGSYFVQTRMALFGSLDEIQRLFKVALPGSEHYFTTVEGGYISVLAAFRHVFSHNRGNADQNFCQQIENFREFSYKETNEVMLDGESVSKMRNAAIDMSRTLIEEVDKELSRQTKNN